MDAEVTFSHLDADKSKVVITPFSREDHPNKLLEYHSPERIYLIATTQGPNATIDRAREWMAAHRAEATIEVVSIADAFDASEAEKVALRILDRLEKEGVPAEAVSADITGGTATMSVGVLAAAISYGVPVTYMPPRRADREGRGTELDDPKRVVIALYHLAGGEGTT